jgi:hypothetical protein
MKIVLILSLILNAVLGFRLYLDSQKPPLERIVIEEKVVEKHMPLQGIETSLVKPLKEHTKSNDSKKMDKAAE